MTYLKQITPFVLVSDLEQTIEFFEDILGFKCGFQAENYAFVRRENVALRLLEVGSDIDLQDKRRQQSCYIDVSDIDALYNSLKPKLDTLPEGRVRAPFDQYYGQREFHVKDADSLLIFFGEAIAA